MLTYRITYTDKNNVVHTHVVFTTVDMIKIRRTARLNGYDAEVEKLTYVPAMYGTQKI